MTTEAGKVRRADQYEPVLSTEVMSDIVNEHYDDYGGVYEFALARAIERATIEAFRAKHLPELNLQRCYEIQRDELMVARVRIAQLESALKSIERGYVNLLESARDRIVMLGGEAACDSLQKMIADDAILPVVCRALKTTAAPAASS